MSAEDWHRLAACLGTPPGMFYPERGDVWALEDARAVCATCPVQAECLNEALATNEQFGVRAGLTIQQRRKLAPSPGEGLEWCVGCVHPIPFPPRPTDPAPSP